MKVSMENISDQRTQTPIKFISSSSSHFLKLITKILLPFSVLSVALSYPLLCNLHILAYGLQLFNFSVGKNYMFLLCNGLLVFIATSSGLIGGSAVGIDLKKSTPEGKGDHCLREFRVEIEPSELKASIPKAQTKALIPEVDQEEQEPKMDSLALVRAKEDVPMVVEAKEQSLELVSVHDEHEYEDKDDGLRPMSNEELNNMSNEELHNMSNEELNKKFEDFIRKMKEGIKLEAQQQLIKVL